MEPRAHIALELKEAGSTLPAGLTAVPYAMPEGYFAAFAAAVLARIRREEAAAELAEVSPLLAGLSKKMPFAVPQGYFATEAPVPSLLDSIGRHNVYAVPEGYFTRLPDALLARVRREAAPAEAPRKAKVVGIGTRWMRVAAAAVVTGVVAIGGWLYESRTPATAADPEAIVQTIRSVPDGTLEEFIETTDPAAASDLAQNGTARADVRSILHDVPVSEIDAFLEQLPQEEAVSEIN